MQISHPPFRVTECYFLLYPDPRRMQIIKAVSCSTGQKRGHRKMLPKCCIDSCLTLWFSKVTDFKHFCLPQNTTIKFIYAHQEDRLDFQQNNSTTMKYWFWGNLLPLVGKEFELVASKAWKAFTNLWSAAGLEKVSPSFYFDPLAFLSQCWYGLYRNTNQGRLILLCRMQFFKTKVWSEQLIGVRSGRKAMEEMTDEWENYYKQLS